MRIAVLMTCFNRRETTLRCLASLCGELELRVGVGERNFDIFLVDDGCTDGTGDAVKKEFPFVKILQTEGNFYWAKGMSHAWSAALEYEKSGSEELKCGVGVKSGSWREDDKFHSRTRTLNSNYDAFLWLNDDVVLNKDFSVSLCLCVKKNPGAVIVGSMQDGAGKKLYGVLKNGLFCGNCVLVPRDVYEKVGMIDGGFAHAWADMDYAMRCQKAGVKVVEVGPVGTCEGHPIRPWLKGVGFRGRCRMLTDPKGWNVHDVWRFQSRHFGVLRALASCLHMVFYVLRGRD